jgi:RNA polymerase sigma factor (sigma-70 family)
VTADVTPPDLEALYRASHSDLVRVATAITGDIEAGRDAVHDAFVSVVRVRATFRGDGTLEAWVWRAVVNSARTRRRAMSDELPESSSTHEADDSVDDADEVRALIRLLPERQRLVLFLRYYADLEYESIADVLGVRPGTVGAALHAAHRTVRRHLQEVCSP